jgi:hypothetical protein
MGATPTPRFNIGDTAWVARLTQETVHLPCPDCLGAHEWAVTTPAGGRLTSPCMRCTDKYTNTGLPSLTYQTVQGRAEARPITGIEINDGEPVEYRSRTGSGSWWTLRDTEAYATEAEAQAVADQMAAAKNAEAVATPEMIDKQRVSVRPLDEARFDEFKNGLWRAWYGYRQLAEDVLDWANETKLSEIDKEALDDILRWRLRADSVGDLEVLIRAVEAYAARPDANPDVKTALAKLPPFQRYAMQAAQPDEWAEMLAGKAA